MQTFSPEKILKDWHKIIFAHLLMDNKNNQLDELYQPIDYILSNTGKQIRPYFLLSINQLFGGDFNQALPAAIAIEQFHNATLIHDDLMDASDFRRGQLSVHKKWNANTALLSGDTLLLKSFEQISKLPQKYQAKVLKVFTKTCIEVCEGQQMDMRFEQQENVSIAEYLEMIRLKTAVLISASFEIGAILADASPEEVVLSKEIGTALGMYFQIQDDWLDSFGEKTGKIKGEDIINNKKNFLYIQALTLSNEGQKNRIHTLFSNKKQETTQKVAEILKIYEELRIETKVKEVLKTYYQAFEQKKQYLNGENNYLEIVDFLVKMIQNRST